MRAEVHPINLQGKPLPKALRETQAPFTGALKIAENRLHAFGRVVTCANLINPRDGAGLPVLPELVDVQLIWLDDKNMRLRGIEQVDGILYAQTWDIKVLNVKS